MSQMDANQPDAAGEAKLPRRDWVLLPLLSLFTIALISLSTEWTARRVFPQYPGNIYQCIVGGNTPDGTRGVPNSVCRGNRGDSPIEDYRLNSCGHRAGMECGPKPPGTYRIVLLGASFVIGEGVPMEKTLAAVLPADLSSRTGGKVDLYNEGMFSESPATIGSHFDQVTAAQPDMILWVLTPFDIKLETVVMSSAGSSPAAGKDDSPPREKLSVMGRIRRRLRVTIATRGIAETTSVLFHYYVGMYSNHLTSVVLLRHLLDRNQSQYVKSYLANPDAEFLNANPGAGWQSNLTRFGADYEQIEAQARAAGVPLVVVLIPNRAQAAMISMGKWPSGADPFRLDEDLRSIVSGRGGIYVDILPDFRDVPSAEQYFYMVNGHPDEHGNALLAGMLARALTSGAVPALGTGPRGPLEPR